MRRDTESSRSAREADILTTKLLGFLQRGRLSSNSRTKAAACLNRYATVVSVGLRNGGGTWIWIMLFLIA